MTLPRSANSVCNTMNLIVVYLICNINVSIITVMLPLTRSRGITDVVRCLWSKDVSEGYTSIIGLAIEIGSHLLNNYPKDNGHLPNNINENKSCNSLPHFRNSFPSSPIVLFSSNKFIRIDEVLHLNE